MKPRYEIWSGSKRLASSGTLAGAVHACEVFDELDQSVLIIHDTVTAKDYDMHGDQI